ncbi:MAG TPA: hypothetical protein VIY52_15370 [Streptosporangiaceae bacterium]
MIILHAADIIDLGLQAGVTAFAPSVTEAATWTPSSSITPSGELDLKTSVAADLGLTEIAAPYLQLLTRMCDLDLFDSEETIHALRTHLLIYLNRIIIRIRATSQPGSS